MMTMEELDKRYRDVELERMRHQLAELSEQLEYENYKILCIRDNFMKIKNEYLVKLGVQENEVQKA